MNDTIYRQSAIDACLRVRNLQAYDEIDEIKALPSAEPKTGKWTIEDVHSATYKYCCSECKAHHRARYDFCPTCGTKMEVQDD